MQHRRPHKTSVSDGLFAARSDRPKPGYEYVSLALTQNQETLVPHSASLPKMQLPVNHRRANSNELKRMTMPLPLPEGAAKRYANPDPTYQQPSASDYYQKIIDPISSTRAEQPLQIAAQHSQARSDATLNWQREMLRHTIEHTSILRRMQRRYHYIVCLLTFVIILLISCIVIFFIKNSKI